MKIPRFENPVLTKELRTRMRGARAFWLLFLYVLVLSLFLFFTYLVWWQSQRNAFNAGNAAFAVGRQFYLTLFCVQAVLVGLITPALTAGGVSIEKEQRTYELLSVSLLPRRSIITGKLLAAVSFVALLLTSSLPLVSLCFLLGGVSPAEVLIAYGLLIVVAFLYGAVGVAWSAISRTTSTATVLAYLTLLALFLATLPLALANIGRAFNGPGFGSGLGALNPVGAVLAGTAQESYFGLRLPAWLPALILNGLLGVILLVVAVHRLEYPRTDRSPLLRLLTAVFTGLLAFFAYGFLLPGGVLGLTGPQRLFVVGILGVCTPLVLVPIFATGEALPPNGLGRSLLSLRAIARGGDPASGLAYALLLIALCALVLFLGAPPDLRPRIVSVIALTFATGWGFGAAGLWFTTLVANRWSALTVTATVMVLCFLIPLTAVAGRTSRQRPSLLDNTVYLSPIKAVEQLSDPAGSFWSDTPRLWGGRAPLLPVTTALYGALGFAFLLAAARAGRRVATPGRAATGIDAAAPSAALPAAASSPSPPPTLPTS